MPSLLLLLAALLAGIDAVWVVAGHFHLDVAAYVRLCLLALALLAAARIYATVRPDPRLSAMLFGTGFLCAFSLGASLLNYLLLTRTGTRIDFALAAMDRALGFDWPRAMAWMAAHPVLNAIAYAAYSPTSLPRSCSRHKIPRASERKRKGPEIIRAFCIRICLDLSKRWHSRAGPAPRPWRRS